MNQRVRARYDRSRGLMLEWLMDDGREQAIPVRVEIRGKETFSVWGVVDSGEAAPDWAEDLTLTLFGGTEGAEQSPGILHEVHALGESGWRAIARGPRAEATLDLVLENDELRAGLHVSCPNGAPALPICGLELRFEHLSVGEDAYFLCAHAYGGRTHGYGRLADLFGIGVPFVHGCIGQGLPLVYLHSDRGGAGIELEFMTEGRPVAWLRPSQAGGSAFSSLNPEPRTLNPIPSADWCVTWSPDRLLLPGQVHAVGGRLSLRPYRGEPVAQMRTWRDALPRRYGIVRVPAPIWTRRCNLIEFNMNPKNGDPVRHGFARLDDPKCRRLIESWKEMGYTVIYCVSPNHVGLNWLSPFDYEPCEELGGLAAEKQFLTWAHELGFHCTLWVTTVGMDRHAPEVKQHPDWFTRRPNGEFFYAWDSTPVTGYVGYAPDADPLSTGWRRWLEGQVTRVIARGYDGIFIDGCIPRASNHARWLWPGEGRNGVQQQVMDLADHVRGLARKSGRELITFVEDESLLAQASCEMSIGRYTPSTPFLKKAYWDHGMGGGPASASPAPQRIPPEMARDYLLVRYASLLVGQVSDGLLEGYYSEESRPWVVQSLVSGLVTRTHSEFVDDPATFRPLGDAVPVPPEQREPAWRLRGHEEFVRLLKFRRDEPLVHEAPMSIEAVRVEGDAAVVGMLRPGRDRAILAVMQFANRPAKVTLRLAEPIDVPGRDELSPEQQSMLRAIRDSRWRAKELVHSMVDSDKPHTGTISPTQGMETEIAPYGFRILELQRIAGGWRKVLSADAIPLKGLKIIMRRSVTPP